MPENPRIEELRRRVQLDPASIAFAALAEEFRRMGRYEEAIETCRGGLQRHPAYLSARVTLGRALIETGEYDAAREELETVLRSAPENLAAIRGLAQIHERLGQSTEMDPHLAAMMNAEVERVALAAARAAQAPPPPPAPPAPEPAVATAPEPVVTTAPEPVVTTAPEPVVATAPEPVVATAPEPVVAAAPEPVVAAAPETVLTAAAELVLETSRTADEPAPFIARQQPVEPEEPVEPVPAALLATVARLERFLVAIDAARHP